MPHLPTKRDRRASRSKGVLERLSVGQVRPTEKRVRRHPDGRVEVEALDGSPVRRAA